jgi:hypothetical protein
MAFDSETYARVLEPTLDLLRNGIPGKLDAALQFVAQSKGLTLVDPNLDRLLTHLQGSGPNDQLLHLMTQAIQGWDHDPSPSWAKRTIAHSTERRSVILDALGVPGSRYNLLNSRILIYSEEELAVVIAEKHAPWFEDRALASAFFWKHFHAQFVRRVGKSQKQGLSKLESSVIDVISRLSDPTRQEVYPVKGLVMGYVQSGKTTHFSGLIAKAADAGYRLIIILAGTLDILRQQTQRRIDKDIVGRELLGTEEYGNDNDWGEFVSHGGRPADLGSFDWERLTNSEDDYKSLSRYLPLLEFKRREQGRPFNHPDNLRQSPAKLVVIKKVPARINKLNSDLKKLREIRSKLENVPTLIIDDESDQASINTIQRPDKADIKKRTSTNRAITNLLEMLPRAQYVGYTATPFANVFIDPKDAADLFPKDFIISLHRPDGYMGASDFYDFNEFYEPGDYRGNCNAYVRDVIGSNEEEINLPKALDSFILAGAIKLFRQDRESSIYEFKHHTMLLHISPGVMVHDRAKRSVEEIFLNGARYQNQAGLTCLRNLFETDFAPVSKARAGRQPFPETFDTLRPFISKCLTKVCSDRPIRVINGQDQYKDDTPDFDKIPVWAILIGGAKLSRGYTIEGLTVSYYRRPTGAGDTLMQMGRWFGFREGYYDLVRLFIGRREKRGNRTIDLYEAFGAVCRDEEALRNELIKYRKDGLTPKQVPPLVRQHLLTLPPTSRNKMFNAVIDSRDYAGDYSEKGSASFDREKLASNIECARVLLSDFVSNRTVDLLFLNSENERREFHAFAGVVEGKSLLTFLKAFHWASAERPPAAELELDYLRRKMELNELNHWTVLMPQIQESRFITLGNTPWSQYCVIERSTATDDRFGVYSEPRHREAAAHIAGVQQVSKANNALNAMRDESRGVLLLYFVAQKGEKNSPISVGFGIQFPGSKVDAGLTWTVKDRESDKVVVTVNNTKPERRRKGRSARRSQ